MASMTDPVYPDDALTHALPYPAGVTLCRQGEPIREVFHIQRGLVKLMRVNASGKERIVGLRSSGWFVGAAAVILGEPAVATAVTLTATEMSRMCAAIFRQRIQTDVGLSWRIHHMHSREIDVDLIESGDLHAVRSRDRLVAFLRALPATPGAGPSEGHRVILPLRQWELGQLLGMTAPYVCRLLRDLEREGTLRRRGSVFLLPDLDARVARRPRLRPHLQKLERASFGT
jgi:CRP/FNR family transcriptional regulator